MLIDFQVTVENVGDAFGGDTVCIRVVHTVS